MFCGVFVEDKNLTVICIYGACIKRDTSVYISEKMSISGLLRETFARRVLVYQDKWFRTTECMVWYFFQNALRESIV